MFGVQRKSLPMVVSVLFLLALVAAACNSAAPAAPVVESAPAVAQATPTTAPEAPAASEPVTETQATTETEVTETQATTETQTTAAEPAAVAATRLFVIDQSQSKASFTLDELLMGAPKTVVGVTSKVEGTITVDMADMTKSSIGPIQIDARDFTTDNNMRNRAIQRFVLQSNSDENRTIVFTPTAITGLPQAAKPGDALELAIAGDLTISGVTKPVTFAANITVDSETQLSGVAKVQVLRSDFGLTIPSVPSVANVTDEVQLELQFVATAQ